MVGAGVGLGLPSPRCVDVDENPLASRALVISQVLSGMKAAAFSGWDRAAPAGSILSLLVAHSNSSLFLTRLVQVAGYGLQLHVPAAAKWNRWSRRPVQ